MFTEEFSFRKDTLHSLPLKNMTYDVKDAQLRGLRLRINPKGTKTFILLKRVNGIQKRIKIGHFPDLTIDQARTKALNLKSAIATGEKAAFDQTGKKRKLLFKELYDRYYNEHSIKENKNPKEYKRVIENHVNPTLGSRYEDTVTRDDIKRLFTQVAEASGKQAANSALSYISAVYNFGIKNDIIKTANPCFGIKKFKPNKRDRFLKLEELKSFFEAVSKEQEIYHDYFRLLLFTGVRKTNLLSAKWSDIDLAFKQWRIAEEKTKNKEVNTIVLPDQAIEILVKRQKANKLSPIKSEYIFPGEGKAGHLACPKKAFGRIKKTMEVSDLRIHDLRRTLASYMAIGGTSLLIIGEALNHKSQTSTEIYARLSKKPVLDAVNLAVANMLNGLNGLAL